MKFKDRLVRCAACGAEFVYTVPEQRQRAAQGLSLDAPAFCKDCRGADVRLAEAAEAAETAERDAVASERPAPARPVGRAKPGTAAPGRRPERPRADRASRPPDRARSRDGRDRGQDRAGKRRGRPRPRQTEVRIRHVGTVKWFDDARGFGFVAEDNGDELFVHGSAILTKGRPVLLQGQSVEYEVEHTDRGLQAVDVVPLP